MSAPLTGHAPKEHALGRWLVIAASMVVIATVVAAIVVMGSPSAQRESRLDERRVRDLDRIAGAVRNHAEQHGALPADLQGFARNVLKRKPASPNVKCLTLLGTAGSRPEWNSRRRSLGHQAIPLESVGMVEQAPMVSQLIRQLGLDVAAVVSPSPEILRQVEGR